MEEMSYVFSVTFFFTAAHFLPALLAASIVTAAFHVISSKQKKCLHCFFLSLFFISRSRSLSPSFSLSFAGLPLFLCLSLALYSKFKDKTINLSLILQKTLIQKQFPLSGLVFIDSIVASAFKDVGGYAISRQNNLELHCFLTSKQIMQI